MNKENLNSIKNKKKDIFWIWCQFQYSEMRFLENLKSNVNSILKGPDFEIHLSLIGPFFKMDSSKISEIEQIAKSSLNIPAILLKYGYSSHKYTSLYIEVLKTKDLINLRNKFIKAIPPHTNYDHKFEPHISLFYGIAKTFEKTQLISKLPNIDLKININKICIAHIDENLDRWRIIEKIKLN